MAERVKFTGDVVVVSSVIANIMEWLPTAITIISGLLGIVWMCLRIYQTWKEICKRGDY